MVCFSCFVLFAPVVVSPCACVFVLYAAPAISRMNWRIKAVGSSVATISLSYYKAERALIDCNQEYELRARANKNKARAEERAKLAAAEQQQAEAHAQQ